MRTLLNKGRGAMHEQMSWRLLASCLIIRCMHINQLLCPRGFIHLPAQDNYTVHVCGQLYQSEQSCRVGAHLTYSTVAAAVGKPPMAYGLLNCFLSCPK